MNQNPSLTRDESCTRQIREVGRQVITLSAVAELMGILGFVQTMPAIGEMGHFTHAFALVVAAMAGWGIATGWGLVRAQLWAWISMLIFGGILTIAGVLLALPFLLMHLEGIVWWQALAERSVGALIFLTGSVVGIRWFGFFARQNVRSYFWAPQHRPYA